MKLLLEHSIEIGEDEKEINWKQLGTVTNKRTYFCGNLKDNKMNLDGQNIQNKYHLKPVKYFIISDTRMWI